MGKDDTLSNGLLTSLKQATAIRCDDSKVQPARMFKAEAPRGQRTLSVREVAEGADQGTPAIEIRTCTTVEPEPMGRLLGGRCFGLDEWYGM